MQGGRGLGDDHLVTRVTHPGARTRHGRHRLHRGTTRQDHRVRRDRARRRVDAGDEAVAATPGPGPQPGERAALAQIDACMLHRERIAAHVARRIHPTVGCDVGAPSVAGRRHRRDQPFDGRRVHPAGVETRRSLHRDPVVGRALVGRGHRQDHIAATDEPRVVRGLALVEPDRPLSEPDGVGRAALGPHHPGGAARRAGPDALALEDHDAIRARLPREDRGPATDGPGADDHDIRVLPWHRGEPYRLVHRTGNR